MPNDLQRLRAQAFHLQTGKCCYCRNPMWLDNPYIFTQRHGITLRQASQWQCTAEHILAKCDGGGDTADNISAACNWCNQKRHKRAVALDSVGYAAFVVRRIFNGRWRPFSLNEPMPLPLAVS